MKNVERAKFLDNQKATSKELFSGFYMKDRIGRTETN